MHNELVQPVRLGVIRAVVCRWQDVCGRASRKRGPYKLYTISRNIYIYISVYHERMDRSCRATITSGVSGFGVFFSGHLFLSWLAPLPRIVSLLCPN